MALPGISKKREEAREASSLADAALADLRGTVVRYGSLWASAGSPVQTSQVSNLRAAIERFVEHEAKAKRLWDDVAFMEET